MRRVEVQKNQGIESLLIHGLNNCGKTHILGSVCQEEKQYGRTNYIVLKGEPTATLLSFDLNGVSIIEISAISEIPGVAKELSGSWCTVLDSVQRLGELANDAVTGGTHIVGAKEDHGREWARLKFEIFKGLMLLRNSCELFVAVCPSRHHENAISKAVRVVPDVPGVSETLVGRFNFVGYLEATALGPDNVQRTVDFRTRVDVVTRCNAPKQPTKKLILPAGEETWAPIKKGLEWALDTTQSIG